MINFQIQGGGGGVAAHKLNTGGRIKKTEMENFENSTRKFLKTGMGNIFVQRGNTKVTKRNKYEEESKNG